MATDIHARVRAFTGSSRSFSRPRAYNCGQVSDENANGGSRISPKTASALHLLGSGGSVLVQDIGDACLKT